jgi:hypothetical protein
MVEDMATSSDRVIIRESVSTHLLSSAVNVFLLYRPYLQLADLNSLNLQSPLSCFLATCYPTQFTELGCTSEGSP